MKLFVVGEFSGDPDEWGSYNPYRAIVIARDEKEASSLCDGCNIVAEIPMDRAVKLMFESYDGD